jgi:hypothetical protein
MATHGEIRWPSLGSFDGRLRGDSHGRRQQSEATRIGSARTDATGGFRKTFTVHSSPGRWVALACQRGCRIKAGASFRIIAAGRG